MSSRGDHRGRDRQAGHATRRDIAISRSADLLHWTPGIRVFEGDDDDPPETEFYGMPLFQWGNQWIGFLEYYDPLNEILNLQLATSRDGDRWARACSRRTYFDVGSSDSWDSTWVAFPPSPRIVAGEEMLFWYTGRPIAHRRPEGVPFRASIGLARAPRDRFAGLRAGPDGGELTTDWIEIGAPRLLLNIGAACDAISVAVTGDDGQPLDGFDHKDCDLDIANGVDVETTWRGQTLQGTSAIGYGCTSALTTPHSTRIDSREPCRRPRSTSTSHGRRPRDPLPAESHTADRATRAGATGANPAARTSLGG